MKKFIALITMLFILMCTGIVAAADNPDKLQSLIGKTVWVTNYSKYSKWVDKPEQWQYLSNLEPLIITDVKVNRLNYELTFKRDDGEVFIWKAKNPYNRDPNAFYNSLEAFMYFKNPYEQYNWSDDIWQSIKSEHPQIGMDKRQLLTCLGQPIQIAKTTTQSNTVYQYIYPNKIVNVENDKVTQIIE